MKKFYIYVIVLSILFCLYSCNDEWKDELYTHMVGLKAPIPDNDNVYKVYVRYKKNGEGLYKQPVVVSGSLKNDKNLEVRIAVDNDTLAALNYAAYTDRTDLYYKQLPKSFYELSSSVCHIPAGSSLGLFDIKFKFSGLNLVDKWVLPLMIEDDPSYTPNRFKGWSKALLYIMPFNDYSGNYSATDMKVYFGNETTNPVNVESRIARVVDENAIFFYAGITEELSEDRELYKINVTFEEPKILAGDTIRNLKVEAENNTIGFKVLGQPTYEIKKEKDRVQPYLERRSVIMNINYEYNDISSSEKALPYRCDGSMVMQRKINTMMLDEDQAIIW